MIYLNYHFKEIFDDIEGNITSSQSLSMLQFYLLKYLIFIYCQNLSLQQALIKCRTSKVYAHHCFLFINQSFCFIIKQIYFMKKILFAAIFALLLLKATAYNNYVEYARYQNTNNKEKIAFSDDELSILLYSNDEAKIYFYRSYDMKPTFTASLSASPKYLQTFTNSQQGNSAIFAADGGLIYTSNFTAKDWQVQVKLKTLQNCNILKVSPSPDKQNFAAICADSTQLVIGNLLKLDDIVDSVEMGFTAQAFQWHPTQNKIAVAGTNKDDGTFHLVIYDAIKKEQTDDYSNDRKNKIKDLEFSSTGQKLAFMQQSSTHPEIITILDFAKPKNPTFLIAPEATQLLELRRSGKLLTAYDTQSSYAWVFDGDSYGHYNSILKSTGISRTGGSLYTLDPLSKEVVASKICRQSNQVFINDALTCAVCQSPCNTCFVKQTQCSSCEDSYYLDEDFYICKGCITNCKTCDAQKCKICLDKFYLDDANSCKSCVDTFIGCLTCTSQACNKCDEVNNWILNKNNQCQCKKNYVKFEDKCIACPNHCSVCKIADTCQVCNTAEHFKPTPVQGKCLCDFGYFEDGIVDQCQTCVTGCSVCDNKATCKTCDTTNNWVLDKQSQVCACQSGYLQIQNKCTLCSKLMEGCSLCTSEHICTICQDGYDLDANTNHCAKHPQDGGISTVVIIIIAFAVLIVIVVAGYLIIRTIRKKKGKKVQTLLESEAENDQEELS